MTRRITMTTLMDHAPRPGGCKCGWRGDDLMSHVEAELRREAEAKGVQMRDEDADGAS